MSIVLSSAPVGDALVAKLSGLCAKQIKSSMEEARGEVSDLSQFLLSAHKLAGGNIEAQGVQEEILEQMRAALAKLQFADRLSQRLLNIANNLDRLESFLSESSSDPQNCDWEGILEEVRHSFSMEEERKLFDEVIGVDTVCEEWEKNKSTPPPELF